MATEKQKLALEHMVENGGIVSQAMLEAGYSPNTAKTPQKLTESKGWNELLEEHIPDSLLLKVGKEGLQATKINNSHTEPDKEIPDYAVRYKYWDTSLKIKGKIVEKIDVEVSTKVISIDE